MSGVFIFVLDRGFVIVGEAEIDQELLFHWHLKKSRVIRRWGTTKGLAELKNGPTAETVLDESVEEHIAFRAVLRILVVTEEGIKKWQKVL